MRYRDIIFVIIKINNYSQFRLKPSSVVIMRLKEIEMSDIAIITGASSGLGAEFAKAIGRRYPNLRLWLIARSAEALSNVANIIGAQRCKIIPMDLTLVNSFTKLQNMLDKDGGSISLLVNDAGIGVYGYMENMTLSSQIALCDTNCRAVTAMTALCLKYMNEGSKIINISSISAFAPTVKMSAYGASKTYILQLSRAVNEELKDRGITCLAVCPPPLSTGFFDAAGIKREDTDKLMQMPRCSVAKVAEGSLDAAEKGRAVYTPTVMYKAYRLLAKILPSSLLVKIASA